MPHEGYDAMIRRGFIATQIGGAVTGDVPSAVTHHDVTLEVNGAQYNVTIEPRATRCAKLLAPERQDG